MPSLTVLTLRITTKTAGCLCLWGWGSPRFERIHALRLRAIFSWRHRKQHERPKFLLFTTLGPRSFFLIHARQQQISIFIHDRRPNLKADWFICETGVGIKYYFHREGGHGRKIQLSDYSFSNSNHSPTISHTNELIC